MPRPNLKCWQPTNLANRAWPPPLFPATHYSSVRARTSCALVIKWRDELYESHFLCSARFADEMLRLCSVARDYSFGLILLFLVVKPNGGEFVSSTLFKSPGD